MLGRNAIGRQILVAKMVDVLDEGIGLAGLQHAGLRQIGQGALALAVAAQRLLQHLHQRAVA